MAVPALLLKHSEFMTMQAAASEVIFGIGAMAEKVLVLPTRFGYADRTQDSKFVIARQ